MVRLDRRELLERAALGATAVSGPSWRVPTGDVAELASPLPELAGLLRGPVVRRGTAGYDAARVLFNTRFDGVKPLAVAYCTSVEDVQKTIRWAGKQHVRLAARAGGHSYGGYSTTPGVILDVGRLRGIRVTPGKAVVGAGARLIDVYSQLWQHGVSIPAGSCPSVGVTGLTLGGGHGFLSRKFGLTSDNVLELELVTAAGKRLVCNAHEHPDLYWACRGGGGGNFGVVTRWTFRTHPVASVATFRVDWPWDQAAQALAAWQSFAPHAPDELFSVFSFAGGGGASPRVSAVGQLLGSRERLTSLLAPLASAGTPTRVAVSSRSYFDAVLMWAGCTSLGACRAGMRSNFAAKSDYARKPLSRAAVATITNAIRSAPSRGILLLDSYGGAINRVPKAATAFVHRDALFSFQYLAYWTGAAGTSANLGWLRDFHTAMRPHVSGQAYVNYIDPDLATWKRAYYGANLPRLVAVKRKVDPGGFFRFPQGIPLRV